MQSHTKKEADGRREMWPELSWPQDESAESRDKEEELRSRAQASTDRKEADGRREMWPELSWPQDESAESLDKEEELRSRAQASTDRMAQSWEPAVFMRQDREQRYWKNKLREGREREAQQAKLIKKLQSKVLEYRNRSQGLQHRQQIEEGELRRRESNLRRSRQSDVRRSSPKTRAELCNCRLPPILTAISEAESALQCLRCQVEELQEADMRILGLEAEREALEQQIKTLQKEGVEFQEWALRRDQDLKITKELLQSEREMAVSLRSQLMEAEREAEKLRRENEHLRNPRSRKEVERRELERGARKRRGLELTDLKEAQERERLEREKAEKEAAESRSALLKAREEALALSFSQAQLMLERAENRNVLEITAALSGALLQEKKEMVMRTLQLETELADAAAKLQMRSSEVTALHNELKEVSLETMELRTQRALDLQSLQRMGDRERDLEGEKQEMEVEISVLREARERDAQKLEELSDLNSSVCAELQVAQTELSRAVERQRRAERERDGLRRERQRLEGVVRALEKVEEELEIERGEHRSLRASLVQLQERASDVEVHRDQLEVQGRFQCLREELDRQTAQKEVEGAELQDERERRSREEDEQQGELQSLRGEPQVTGEQLQEQEVQRGERQREREALSSELGQRDGEVGALRSRVEDLIREKEELSGLLEESRAALAEEQRTQKWKEKEMLMEVQRWKEQTGLAWKEIQALGFRVIEGERAAVALEREKERSSMQLRETETRVRGFQEAVARLEARVVELEGDKEGLSKELMIKEREVDTLREEVEREQWEKEKVGSSLESREERREVAGAQQITPRGEVCKLTEAQDRAGAEVREKEAEEEQLSGRPQSDSSQRREGGPAETHGGMDDTAYGGSAEGLRERVSALLVEREERDALLRERDSEVNALKRRVDDLSEERARLTTALELTKAALFRCMEESRQLEVDRGTGSDSLSRTQEAQVRTDEEDVVLQSLRPRVLELEEQVRHLRESLASDHRERAEFIQQVFWQNEKLLTLSLNLYDFLVIMSQSPLPSVSESETQRLDTSRRQTAQKEVERSELQEERERRSREEDEQQGELQSLRGEPQVTGEQLQEQEVQRGERQREREALSSELGQRDGEVGALRSRVEDLIREKEELSGLLEESHAALAEEQRTQKWKEKEMLMEVQRWKEQTGLAWKEIQALGFRVMEGERAAVALEREKERSSMQLRETETRVRGFQEAVARLEARVVELEGDKEGLSKELMIKEREVDTLREEVEREQWEKEKVGSSLESREERREVAGAQQITPRGELCKLTETQDRAGAEVREKEAEEEQLSGRPQSDSSQRREGGPAETHGGMDDTAYGGSAEGLRERVSALLVEREERDALLRERDSEVNALKRRVDDLSEERARLTTALELTKAALFRCMEESRQLEVDRGTGSDSLSRTQEAQVRTDEEDVVLQSLRPRVLELEEQVRHLRESLASDHRERAEFIQQVFWQNEKLLTLSLNLYDFLVIMSQSPLPSVSESETQRLDTSRRQTAQKEVERSELQEERERRSREEDEQQGELQSLRGEPQVTGEQLQEQEVQRGERQREREALSSELGQRDGEVGALRSRVEDLIREKEELSGLLEESHAALAEEQRTQKWKEKEMLMEVQRWKEQTGLAWKEIQALGFRVMEGERAAVALEREKERSSMQLRETETRVRGFQEAVARLEARVVELEGDKEGLSKELMIKEREVDTLREEVEREQWEKEKVGSSLESREERREVAGAQQITPRGELCKLTETQDRAGAEVREKEAEEEQLSGRPQSDSSQRREGGPAETHGGMDDTAYGGSAEGLRERVSALLVEREERDALLRERDSEVNALKRRVDDLSEERARLTTALELTKAALFRCMEESRQLEVDRGTGSDSLSRTQEAQVRTDEEDVVLHSLRPQVLELEEQVRHLRESLASDHRERAEFIQQVFWQNEKLLTLSLNLYDFLVIMSQSPLPSVSESETQRLDTSRREEEFHSSLNQSLSTAYL